MEDAIEKKELHMAPFSIIMSGIDLHGNRKVALKYAAWLVVLKSMIQSHRGRTTGHTM